MKTRWLKPVALGVAGLLVVAAALQVIGLLPKLGTSTIDRSQPAVLQAVRDLSQYHAAAGDYQVVVDIEKDVAWVPSSIAGERTLFVAAGSVDAFIDFGKLADGNIAVSEDRTSVQLTLPAPQLAKPNLDNKRSYVFSQERGLIDTIGALVEPPQQQQFYVAAEQKISEAAQRSGLGERARGNTRAMLTGMMQALGYRVTFQESPPPQ
ncbi:DUF4230 domain-containing protein [Kibdelosporangium phytohabitans]|uniref:DUF4230 domain-containing protein n=1 Tax=Kibdelosporangium phytohabitans TaxID=860235 RepID=A0A0N7F334_9PSEU|nr:DUF4230 domain-containing protein [Kibdelosporangium phytohabitans]ALG07519.1 hypothetical protein AOZ06_11870 [Kibdelosporangium phytohabitans]MBE1471561.1 hypothetical protein [Kibdelosporangium phytohabitans]